MSFCGGLVIVFSSSYPFLGIPSVEPITGPLCSRRAADHHQFHQAEPQHFPGRHGHAVVCHDGVRANHLGVQVRQLHWFLRLRVFSMQKPKETTTGFLGNMFPNLTNWSLLGTLFDPAGSSSWAWKSNRGGGYKLVPIENPQFFRPSIAIWENLGRRWASSSQSHL